MNPCAPTFIPTTEDGFSSGEDAPSMEAQHSGREVCPKPRQVNELPSITVDSDKYDTMFPALRGVQVDGRSIRSPRLVNQQRGEKANKLKLTEGQVLRSMPGGEKQTTKEYKKSEYQKAEEANNDSHNESDGSSSEEVEYLKPTVYTPKKSLEYLKPTVYTPPTSSRESHRSTSRSKKTVRSTSARSRTRSPRRSWRPPTPHPEGKPRGSKSHRPPTPVTQVNAPARYPSPAAYPPLSYNHYYPGHHNQVMQQHMSYTPYVFLPMPHVTTPSVMPYTTWPMPPAPCPAPMVQPPTARYSPEPGCHYGRAYGPRLNGDGGALYGPPPPQAYFHPQPPVQLQTQQESQTATDDDAHSQPLSHPPTENDNKKGASRSKLIKSRHERKTSMSSSVLASDGSAIATPLKTQVEKIKRESRGASAIANHDKHPDI